MHAATRLAFATGDSLGREEATRVARRLPDLVEILADKTTAQVDNSRWAMPDRRENAELPYAFVSSTDPASRSPMLDGLAGAFKAAEGLRQKVAPPLRPSPLASAVMALSAQPAADRPPHPSSWPARAPRIGPSVVTR
jgi:hypothetical protein